MIKFKVEPSGKPTFWDRNMRPLVLWVIVIGVCISIAGCDNIKVIDSRCDDLYWGSLDGAPHNQEVDRLFFIKHPECVNELIR